jgi:phage terminase large subunit
MSNVVLDKILSEQEAKSYNIVENEKGIEQKYLDQLSRCILNEAKNSASLFNWKVYGLGLKAEKPNRIYSHFNKITLDEFKALKSTTYYGVDWGQVDPFAILEAKYYDGTLYLNELNYASENDIKGQLSTQLLEQIRNEDEGLVKYLFTRLDLNKSNYVICDNNRPQKVMSLRQLGYDYAITSPKGKGSIKDGIDLLQTINVCYTENSTNFEYETENYQWKTDRYNLIVDEPLDLDNHLMDVLRYIALFLKNQRIIKNI